MKTYLLIILLFAICYSLEISTDTLRTEQFYGDYSNSHFDTFIINNSYTTLAIDSIRVENIKIPCSAYQLTLSFLVNNVSINYHSQINWDSGYGIQDVSYGNLIFPRRSTIVVQSRLDLCVFCPVAKARETNLFGDTMLVKLRFYSSGAIDSVYVLSKQRIISTNIINRFVSVRNNNSLYNNHYYNLSGQKVIINQNNAILYKKRLH
jgi:hypothetical protein